VTDLGGPVGEEVEVKRVEEIFHSGTFDLILLSSDVEIGIAETSSRYRNPLCGVKLGAECSLCCDSLKKPQCGSTIPRLTWLNIDLTDGACEG